VVKIRPDVISIKATPARPAVASFVDNEWQIKTDYSTDDTAGSYIVLKADGSVVRRTLDAEGFIIHEIEIKGASK